MIDSLRVRDSVLRNLGRRASERDGAGLCTELKCNS